MSGHGNKLNERGVLTLWEQQRERLVRTRKETDRARRTHVLETVEGRTYQDTERNRPSRVHSRPGDSRGRDLSGHRKKPTEQGTLTSWRRQTDGLVRTRKETDRTGPTHVLERAVGGTCQDTETNWPSEAHSQTGGSRGRDLS